MNELLVRMILDLFREISYTSRIKLGFSVAPKRVNQNSLTKTRNFMYVEMYKGITTVELYTDVDSFVRIGEVEDIRSSSDCILQTFKKNQDIELPSNYMVITFYEVVNFMKDSSTILEKDLVEVTYTNSLSINHPVQILERLFQFFGNKMIFTLVSEKYPGELLTIHYVNRSACLIRIEHGVTVLQIINLFRFREIFGDYQILTVSKVNIPKNFIAFTDDVRLVASQNNLLFKEENYD